MTRFVLVCLAGLLFAAATHILVVLLVPGYSQNDAWSRISERLPDRDFAELARQTPPLDFDTDPQFRVAICRFDLEDLPLGITADKGGDLWSLSIFNTENENIYSLNDRLVTDEFLDLIIVNPGQLRELQEIGARELEKRIVVPIDFDQGYAVLRAFQADATRKAEIDLFFERADCFDFIPDLRDTGDADPNADAQENS